MKLDQKAQQVIEYLLLVAAVVAGVLGVSGPMGPMTNAVQRSLNLAVETISQSYMWHTGAPTPCNVACGIGTQTRTVWCQDEMGKTVDDSYCANKGRKPPETINCNAGNCGVYNWVGSGWSSCSQLCGGGIQTQATVVCKDSGGVVVADNLCPPPKPTQQTCNNQPCYIWQASNTCVGLCSEPCGIGMCDQGINCLDTLTGLPTDISKCPLPLKPPAQIFCNTALTCGYQWLTSDWNPCNKTCEDFISPPVTQKTRTVQCIRLADGAVVGDASCGGIPKPVTTGTCSIPPCNHWDIPGGWDTCTKPCGTGTQGAIVKCLDKNNVEIDPSLCDPGSKPSSSRNCNTGVCQWVTDPAYPACVAAGSCGLSNQTRNVWCIQAGFPAVKLEQQYCFNANGHLAPAESCALPTSTDCTQTQNCYQTSGCCGNGAVDNFPPAPYSEQCDDGDAAHGNGNGVCPKTCSTSCTLNGCPCVYAAGTAWGACNADAQVTALDGASATATDSTGITTGTITLSCSNGSWTPVTQNCYTCSDGSKNQGETGVDCGGPCPACVCNNNWVNSGCGLNGCTGKMYQVNNCTGKDCGVDCMGAGTTHCQDDASCTPCVDNWTNNGCGLNGCTGQMNQVNICTGGLCGANCGGSGTSKCVVDASCTLCADNWTNNGCGLNGCTGQMNQINNCTGGLCGANCGGSGTSKCVADASCTSCVDNWTNNGCGLNGCTGQMNQINNCTGGLCGANCGGSGTSKCVADASCVAPTCTDNWVNNGCSPTGGCSSGNQNQINYCTGTGCGSNCNGSGTSRCVADASCVAPTCTDNWVNNGCSPTGGCSSGNQNQINYCTGTGCGSNCNGSGTSRCVADASCVACTPSCSWWIDDPDLGWYLYTKPCGSDGCGGSCGSCSPAAYSTCIYDQICFCSAPFSTCNAPDPSGCNNDQCGYDACNAYCCKTTPDCGFKWRYYMIDPGGGGWNPASQCSNKYGAEGASCDAPGVTAPYIAGYCDVWGDTMEAHCEP